LLKTLNSLTDKIPGELTNQIRRLVYEPDSNPFDLSFPTWTARWWKWFHSIPKEDSPALDRTGKFCDRSQHHPNVWFLAGTLGGSATRKCNIPSEKAILFPIITSAFSYAVDPYLRTEEELTKTTKEDIDKVSKLKLKLNDTIFDDIRKFRIRSDPFDDVINGQPTRAVSDGYWIFLKPLHSGKLKIYFVGENVDFFNEVTYYISIF